MVKEFLKEYNSTAPIGYVLRNNFSEFCIRIHNLNDKRYPDNNIDRDEIVSRFKKLLDSVCAEKKYKVLSVCMTVIKIKWKTIG